MVVSGSPPPLAVNLTTSKAGAGRERLASRCKISVGFKLADFLTAVRVGNKAFDAGRSVGKLASAGRSGSGDGLHCVVWLVSVDSRTIPPTGSLDEKKRKVYFCHTALKT